jgi:hypothetical protein
MKNVDDILRRSVHNTIQRNIVGRNSQLTIIVFKVLTVNTLNIVLIISHFVIEIYFQLYILWQFGTYVVFPNAEPCGIPSRNLFLWYCMVNISSSEVTFAFVYK